MGDHTLIHTYIYIDILLYTLIYVLFFDEKVHNRLERVAGAFWLQREIAEKQYEK